MRARKRLRAPESLTMELEHFFTTAESLCLCGGRGRREKGRREAEGGVNGKGAKDGDGGDDADGGKGK